MRENKNTNHFIDQKDEYPVFTVVEVFTKSGDESENYRGIDYLQALDVFNKIIRVNMRDNFKDSFVEIRKYYDELELEFDIVDVVNMWEV